MGRVDGKVAFITGAARGQGRSHALRLAEEGADIIAVDLCRPVETAPYEMATPDDLAETAKLVEDFDRRIVTRQADVRDLGQLQAVVQEGLSELGHIDIVCANAGIASFAPALEMDEQTWQEMIDINLSGVWKTIRAAVPPMVERGQGGSVIITSSVAGLFGFPNLANYVAAKHGVVGLMRVLTQELAPHMIRVNTVNPTTVNTPMVMSDAFFRLVRPDLEQPDPGRHGRGLHRPQRAARAVGRTDRHQQRRAVAGLRRGPLRHRRGPARRRRVLPEDRRHARRSSPSRARPSVDDDLAARRAGLAARIVGRGREIDLVLAAVVGRARPAARGPAGHLQEHDPAGHHRRAGASRCCSWRATPS